MNNASIKEYYTNLYKLYYNAVNMISGINQSLNSQNKDISIPVITDENVISTINLPSFLYLDSKVQELSNSINSILNLPKSGEAWLTQNNAGKYKINVVQSNIAPPVPQLFDTSNISASFKDNDFLKNFITPFTSLRINIDNKNIKYINKFQIKQLSFKSKDIFDQITSNSLYYSEYQNKIYNYSLEIEDDSFYKETTRVIDMPYTRSKFISSFKIIDIVVNSNNSPNPYVDIDGKLIYDIILDNITYENRYNSAETFSLKVGDHLTLVNNYTIYEILSVVNESSSDNKQYKLTLKELVGHTYIQTYYENNNMELAFYEYDDSSNMYIDVPLGDDEFIVLFIAAIHNNVIGDYTEGIPINLNDVYIVNDDITRSQFLINKKQISYTSFFKQYCKNFNELLLGLSQLVTDLPNRYSKPQLVELQTSKQIKELITKQISSDTLKQVQINEHILINTIQQDFEKYKTTKEEQRANIETAKQEISDITDSILSGKQSSTLLTELDTARNNLSDAYINFASASNAINKYKEDISSLRNAKYRIRGILDTTEFETYISDNYPGVRVIGLDVEYKYISASSRERAEIINNNLFSNWNKMDSVDKELVISFDDNDNMFIDYVNDVESENIIKWNQIDIPINENEIVIMRHRYKYSVGQPFMTVYSPWSEEHEEKLDNSESFDSLQNDLDQNDIDMITSNVINTVLSGSYHNHLNDMYNDMINNRIFFHSAYNIFSGYTDDNGAPLSIKDKLDAFEKTLGDYEIKNQLDLLTEKFEEYEEKTGGLSLPAYQLFITINNTKYELHNNIFKEIVLPISSSSSIPGKTIRGEFIISIKNNSKKQLKLYTLFNGSGEEAIQDANYAAGQNYNRIIYLRATNPFKPDDSNQLKNLYGDYFSAGFNESSFSVDDLSGDYNDNITGLSHKAIGGGDEYAISFSYEYALGIENVFANESVPFDERYYELLFDIKTNPIYGNNEHYGIRIKCKTI